MDLVTMATPNHIGGLLDGFPRSFTTVFLFVTERVTASGVFCGLVWRVGTIPNSTHVYCRISTEYGREYYDGYLGRVCH